MNRLNRILLATDFSEASSNALDHASVIAAKNDAELHVLHVSRVYSDAQRGALAEQMPDAARHQEVLDRLTGKSMESLRPRFEARLFRKVIAAPDPGTAIVEYARDNRIDLVIVGTHGRTGLPHVVLGSVAERVLRLSPVSVLVVGGAKEQALRKGTYNRVMVPVDFSEPSRLALEHAVEICKQHRARLTVVHVIERIPYPAYYMSGRGAALELFPQLREQARAALTDLAARVDVDHDIVLLEGRAPHEIDAAARTHDVDLIVMGTHGLGGVERLLLGSTTERVVRSAPCPVLAVRSAQPENV